MGWRGPMTHRQFLAWQTFFDLEYEVPNRSDLYIMQLTDVVNQVPVLSGKKTFDGNRWLIKTRRPVVETVTDELDRKEWLDQSKRDEQMFCSLFGS